MKLPFLLLVLAPLAACTSAEREQSGQAMTERIPDNLRNESSTTEAAPATGRRHGYLRRLAADGSGHYTATVDYIQFLSGPAAVAAARRRGDAAMDVVNGDTIYSVFDEYYIINDDAGLRTLPLSPEATFRFWRAGRNGLEQYPATPAKALARGAEALYRPPYIIETQDGRITGLSEQFVP